MRTAAILRADDQDGQLKDRHIDALCALGGEPLVARAARMLSGSGRLGKLIVTVPRGAGSAVGNALQDWVPGHGGVVVECDGSHAAMHCALDLLPTCEIVVIHEARRPLAPVEVLDRVVDTVQAGAPAAVPTVEVTETVKEIDAAGWVRSTIPRELLRCVQSPVAVRGDILLAAHQHCGWPDRLEPDHVGISDLGGVTVPGHPAGFAILDRSELPVAAALASAHSL